MANLLVVTIYSWKPGTAGRFTRSWGAAGGGESDGINETIVLALWQSLAPTRAQGPGKPDYPPNAKPEASLELL